MIVSPGRAFASALRRSPALLTRVPEPHEPPLAPGAGAAD